MRFAFRSGYTAEQIHEMTSIDPWFLEQLRQIVELEQASQAMAQHLYKQGSPGAAGGSQTGTAPNGDGKGGKEDVIDAEFEVKK